MRRNITKTILVTLCCFFSAARVSAQTFRDFYFEYTILDVAETLVSVKANRSFQYSNAAIPEKVLYKEKVLTVATIENHGFSHCTSLTSITIPNSVTHIGDMAFYGCTDLASITIPNSVTDIGYVAFGGCTGLKSITIPNSVTTIDEHAFRDCTGLTSITIPNSVTEIRRFTFLNCTGLTSITIPNSVKKIKGGAFSGCTGLTSVTIPNSVATIDGGAFYGCESLTAITIPESVTYVDNSAFNHCSKLTSVTVAETNPFYDSREDCDAIINTRTNTLCVGCSKTVIPNSVTAIGSAAFKGCTDLTSITIPNSVTGIEGEAFSGCINLAKIYSKLVFPPLGNWQYSFFDAKIYPTCELYIPKGSMDAYKSTYPWSQFEYIKELDYEATGIENISKNSIKVSVNNGIIEINGADGAMIEVYCMDGKMIYRGKNSRIPVEKGTYIVRVSGKTFKVSC